MSNEEDHLVPTGAEQTPSSHLKNQPTGPRISVAHLTTVHRRDDVRIAFRECRSLAKEPDIDLTLYVADGLGSEAQCSLGFPIKDLGKRPRSRLLRPAFSLFVGAKMLWQARPEILHIHDPELLPLGALQRALGNRTVFDMHENVPKQLLTKPWIPNGLRQITAAIYGSLERTLLSWSSVVFAEVSYAADYTFIRRSCLALNYVDITAFPVGARKTAQASVGYVGGISPERGILKLVRAMEVVRATIPDATVICIGDIDKRIMADPNTIRAINEGWLRIESRMLASFAWDLIRNCTCGVAVLQPIPNYIGSYPTKLFEYMALGMPFVCSNFDLYQKLVDETDAGIAVDSESEESIANALTRLLSDDTLATKMGLAGRNAAEAKYSWQSQAQRIISLYRELRC